MCGDEGWTEWVNFDTVCHFRHPIPSKQILESLCNNSIFLYVVLWFANLNLAKTDFLCQKVQPYWAFLGMSLSKTRWVGFISPCVISATGMFTRALHVQSLETRAVINPWPPHESVGQRHWTLGYIPLRVERSVQSQNDKACWTKTIALRVSVLILQ